MRNMKGDKLKYMSDVVRRLLWGEVTEEEREQWMREVEEAHCGEVLERLSDEGYVDRRLAGYKAWDENKAFRRFVEEVERIKKRRQLRRRMAWSAVAAGVACLVGVALLLVPERQVECGGAERGGGAGEHQGDFAVGRGRDGGHPGGFDADNRQRGEPHPLCGRKVDLREKGKGGEVGV